jgi:predicted nucleic acid-binding protein
VLINGSVHLVGLQTEDMSRMTEAGRAYKLDFGHAYQYASADKLGFVLVSFDSDFDRTPRRRKSPGEIEPDRVNEPKT